MPFSIGHATNLVNGDQSYSFSAKESPQAFFSGLVWSQRIACLRRRTVCLAMATQKQTLSESDDLESGDTDPYGDHPNS
jgi:hypothetical protein